MAPQTAGRIGTLIHPPGGVVAKVLVGGTALPTDAFKLPRLLATLTHTFLPVGSVGWVQRDRHRGWMFLLLRLRLFDRRRRRLQLLYTIDRIPKILDINTNAVQSQNCSSHRLPPHVRAALNHANVLERTVQLVLFAILSDVKAHHVLQLDRNRMF